MNESLKLIQEGRATHGLFYLFTFIIGTGAIFMGMMARNKLLQIIFFFYCVLTISFDFNYALATGTQFSLDDLQIGLNSKEHILSSIAKYCTIYIPFIVIAILYIFSAFIKRNFKQQRIKGLILLLFISTTFSFIILQKTNGNRSCFPSPIKAISLFTYFNLNGLYAGQRSTDFQFQLSSEGFDHIIFIVDESIRGDLISLDTLDNLFVINDYGVASSGAICSDYSNIILISGILPHQLPDLDHLSRRNPTLFQYAKYNKYSTALIDGQSWNTTRPDGFMTMDDNNFIDYKAAISKLAKNGLEYTDMIGIEKIDSLIRNHDKTFTYFIKHGSHFPYQNAYPDTFRLSKEQILNIPEKYNSQLSYFTSLGWNTDYFVSKLLETCKDIDNLLIVYTSDHGQNLDDHPDIEITHCYKGEGISAMASVPLIVFSKGPNNSSLYFERNKSSHFQIFGYLLSEMGFITDPIKNNEHYYFSGDIYGRSKLYKNQFKIEELN